MTKEWYDALNVFAEEVKTNVQEIVGIEPVSFWWGYKLYLFTKSTEDAKRVAKLVRIGFEDISSWTVLEASIEDVIQRKEVIVIHFSNNKQ